MMGEGMAVAGSRGDAVAAWLSGKTRAAMRTILRTPSRAAASVLEIALVLMTASLAADLALLLFVQGDSTPVPAPAPVTFPDDGGAQKNGGAIATLGRYDPFFRKGVKRQVAETDSAPLPGTALDLKLFGLRSSASDESGIAVIATPDGKQGVYHVGDEPIGGVRIATIAMDHVVLDRDGMREALWLGERRRAEARSALRPEPKTAADADRQPVIEVTDFAAMFDLLETEPVFRDGEFHGIVIKGPAFATFLQRNGLIPGDIVLAVEDMPLNADASFERLEALSGARSVTVDIERNGERRRVVLTSGN